MTKSKFKMSVLILAALTSFQLQGLCLKDCPVEEGKKSAPKEMPTFQYSEQRESSHNLEDVKNSVLGDMKIQIGHQKIEIGGFQNSNQNIIDNSINSTIILGDMKK